MFTRHLNRAQSLLWTTHRRNVRIAVLTAEQQINQIPNVELFALIFCVCFLSLICVHLHVAILSSTKTVSFRFIDKEGGTKRFYREVFIEPIKVPHTPTQHKAITGAEDYSPSSPKEPEQSPFSKYSYLIKLDDRAVILQGLPILIDHYDLALMMASEFEAQSEFVRLESMPISDIAINLIERDARSNAIPMDMRRRGYTQSVLSHFENDLLLYVLTVIFTVFVIHCIRFYEFCYFANAQNRGKSTFL